MININSDTVLALTNGTAGQKVESSNDIAINVNDY